MKYRRKQVELSVLDDGSVLAVVREEDRQKDYYVTVKRVSGSLTKMLALADDELSEEDAPSLLGDADPF